MKFDEYGCLVMERDGYPGDLGDSCAETCRYNLLEDFGFTINLYRFYSTKGFLRHPDVPPSWREDDFSADQALPLMLCGVRDTRLQFKSFACFAVQTESYQLLRFFTFIQALIFLIPLRWNDGKKRFESGADSSADYLNFFMCMLYLSRLGFALNVVKRLIPKARMEGKIASYYIGQPNSSWYTDLYFKQIKEVYETR